jgi:glycosyltransferase involved in cell wall biosynthesis
MTNSTDAQRRPEAIVVVPCFNEARRLDPQAFAAFLSECRNVTFLFVDDGSTDDTPLVVERLRQQHPRQVWSLRLSENVGKGEAVRRGVQVALRRRPAMFGYWDADLATPLDAIPQFCDVLRARPNISLVMGSRVALLGRQIRRRGMRHFLGRAFATAASIVLRLPVYDTQCGAKLFRVTPATVDLFSRPFGARWIFDVEILARLLRRAGRRDLCESIYEVPLEKWEDVDGSRLRPRDFLVATVDLASIYWRYMRGRTKSATVKQAGAVGSNSDQRWAA